MGKEKLFTVSIQDCRVDTFRCGGKGGQNVNKRDTGVRITHEPSGAIGLSTRHRTQFLNKKDAFLKMAHDPRFVHWHKMTAAKMMGQETMEDRIDRMMQPVNLLIEGTGPKGWETLT